MSLPLQAVSPSREEERERGREGGRREGRMEEGTE
jgi:hypothetical protein